jgi:hypothetical protein
VSHFAEALTEDTALPLIEPPLDVLDPAITLSVGNGIEQLVCQVNGAAHAAHAFIRNLGLDCCAADRLDGQSPAAVWVGVAKSTHEFKGQSDGHVTLGVDISATSSESTIPVGNITLAGC